MIKWLFHKNLNDSQSSNERQKIDYFAIGVDNFNKGQYKQAMEFFQASIEQNPNLEHGYLKLAEVYFHLNDENSAKKTLYRLLNINPENIQALSLLQRTSQNTIQTDFSKSSVNLISSSYFKSHIDQSDNGKNYVIIPPDINQTPFYAIDYPDGNRIYVEIYTDGMQFCGRIMPPDKYSLFPWKCFKSPKGSVVIPDLIIVKGNCTTINTIGRKAFQECEIEQIALPNSILTIGYSAFTCCRHLKKIYIPDSVENIETLAFCGCTTLKEVRLSQKLQTIYAYTFVGTAIESINIPASVVKIDEMAFPSTIRKVTLFGEPPVIEENSFGDKSSIETQFFVSQKYLHLYKHAKFWQTLNIIPY